MKKHRKPELNNDFDGILGRSLKNWAAHSTPPADSREKLLALAAAGETPPPAARRRSLFFGLSFLDYSAYRVPTHPIGDWINVPLTQSRPWTFQFATSYRLAI